MVITRAGRQRVKEWASFFFIIFFVLQICTASSMSDAAQVYINEAGVAWLRMWDLIFPFVFLKLYICIPFFLFALLLSLISS